MTCSVLRSNGERIGQHVQPNHSFKNHKMKTQIALITLTAIFSWCGQSHSHAQTMKELFQLVINVNEDFEASEQVMASYFINLGESHLNTLQRLEESGKATASDIKQKQRLEAALLPVSSLNRKRVGETATAGSAIKRSGPQYDPAIAEEVFEIVGAEKMTSAIQAQVFYKVKRRVQRLQMNSHGPMCLLLDDKFAKSVGVSDSQVQQIKKLTETTSKTFRSGPGKEFSDLEQLYREHWQDMLQQLDTKQRKTAEKMIGAPVQWFRCIEPVQFRQLDGKTPLLTNYDLRIADLAKKLEKDMKTLTYDDLEKEGLTVFHMHFRRMLSMNFVWDELELSVSQRKKLHADFVERKLKDMFLIANAAGSRLDQILSGDSHLPEYTKDNFTEHQQQWLKHFEFQMLTGEYVSSFGLMHPGVINVLEMSDDQRAKIRRLRNDFEKQRSMLMSKLYQRRDEVLKQYNEDIARILTDKQHEMYTLYTGQSLKPTESK